MAALAYTADLQNLISLRLLFQQYAALQANEKELIDKTWTTGSPGGVVARVLTLINQRAQDYTLAGATAAPDVWEHLFVTGCCLYLAKTLRKTEEDMRNWWREYRDAWKEARETFTIDPATAAAMTNSTLHGQGIRFYVLTAGTALQPPRHFPTSMIDESTQWVLNYTFNNAQWRFRRRQARMRIRVVNIVGATWTEVTKTLTLASGFTDYPDLVAGDRFRVAEDGSGVLAGDYLVATRASADAITLATSLSSAGVDLGAVVDGNVVFVRYGGLGALETFDSNASESWYHEGDNLRMQWADEDRIAMEMSGRWNRSSATLRGAPVMFYMEERVAAGKVFFFSPEPDQDYSLRGAVNVAGPTIPTNSTDTAPFLRFPAEMRPHLKDMVLAQVYRKAGVKEGNDLWREAVENVNRLFGRYEGPGASDEHPEPRDVYNDASAISGGYGETGMLGGGLL